MAGYDPRISGWWRTKNRTYKRRWPIRIRDKETLNEIVELLSTADPSYPVIWMTASDNSQVANVDDLLRKQGRLLHRVSIWTNGYEVHIRSGLGAKTEVRVDPYLETVNLSVPERILGVIDAGGISLAPWHFVAGVPVVAKTDRDTIDQRQWERKVQRGAGLHGAIWGGTVSVLLGVLAKAVGWID